MTHRLCRGLALLTSQIIWRSYLLDFNIDDVKHQYTIQGEKVDEGSTSLPPSQKNLFIRAFNFAAETMLKIYWQLMPVSVVSWNQSLRLGGLHLDLPKPD